MELAVQAATEAKLVVGAAERYHSVADLEGLETGRVMAPQLEAIPVEFGHLRHFSRRHQAPNHHCSDMGPHGWRPVGVLPTSGHTTE